MMRLFINALAASAGGGLTYLRNVVPHLSERDDVHTIVLLSGRSRDLIPQIKNISFMQPPDSVGIGARFWFEQRAVREYIRRGQAEILLSAGNFAILNSPVPQILLSRNSLYTSRLFNSDLRDRGEYRLWIETQLKGTLAKWSIEVADCTVAPSEAFAAELQRWTGRNIRAIHHGFDRSAFLADAPLPACIQEQLGSKANAVRLLFVSHYNYYRNFETLFRAIPLIKQRLGSREVLLFLTCKLASGANPGSYRTDCAASLVHKLGISSNVIELGAVPYRLLHHVYRAADLYVSPAYTESFAHPLVESMSSGLPVVASDLPVHKEVCGPAALYFERLSPEQLAERVVEIAESPELAAKLSKEGVKRSAKFSWKKHVECIVELAKNLRSRVD